MSIDRKKIANREAVRDSFASVARKSFGKSATMPCATRWRSITGSARSAA
jgi:hypothetical protein